MKFSSKTKKEKVNIEKANSWPMNVAANVVAYFIYILLKESLM